MIFFSNCWVETGVPGVKPPWGPEQWDWESAGLLPVTNENKCSWSKSEDQDCIGPHFGHPLAIFAYQYSMHNSW